MKDAKYFDKEEKIAPIDEIALLME